MGADAEHRAGWGRHLLSPMQVFRRHDRRWVQWSPMDALMLKWVALQVERDLQKHSYCHHLKGYGGMPGGQ